MSGAVLFEHQTQTQATAIPTKVCFDLISSVCVLIAIIFYRVQQAQSLRRRMAVMNTRTVMPSNNVPGVQMGGAVQSVPSGAVSPANSMNAPGLGGGGAGGAGGGGGLGGMQSPHQPGIGLKPNTQTPPANVLQVVKQVQEEAARQQAPHGGYGKVNPTAVVPGQNMPPPQIRALAHMAGPGQGNYFKNTAKIVSPYFLFPTKMLQMPEKRCLRLNLLSRTFMT